MTNYTYTTTTVSEYLDSHPQTILACKLRHSGMERSQRIEIVKGQDAPEKTHHLSNGSNLYHALQRNNTTEYIVGGKLPGKAGFWFAVRCEN